MEQLLVLMIIVFGLAIFGALAAAVGADSRDTIARRLEPALRI